tara:strand:+ start:530 stop:1507 length:978 start_codon:yes stop_codon:yes gene_type:complete
MNLDDTAFSSTASTTRPQTSAGVLPNQMSGYSMTETASGVARVKLRYASIAKPTTVPTLAENTAAGNVTIGNHKVKVTFLTAEGETEPGSASSAVACAGSKKIDLTAIPVVLSGDGGLFVTGRNIYMNAAGRNEVQTLTLTAGATNDTFKLTKTTESSAVTIGAPDYTGVTLTQIQTALTSIASIAGAYTATGATGGPFTITFNGSLADTDVGPITVTSKTGAADGSVAETTKGVAQGTTYYKVTTGATAVIADNTTTTYTVNLSDATLGGYTAAPSENTSGVLVADVRLAADSTHSHDFPAPVSAHLLRAEITTGAVTTTVYGR